MTKTCLFPSGQMMTYVMTGKFTAPNDAWRHNRFDLTDYELFVMTEGTLYISYDGENFTIRPGEYLILPPRPGAWREGFQESYCAFYWLHFTWPFSEGKSLCPVFSSASPDKMFAIAQQGQIPQPDKLAVLMKQLQDSVKSGYPQIALDAMSTSVLTELYSQLFIHNPADAAFRSGKQVYSDIFDYIQLHISENIKVSDIAAQFGYNVKYLSHLFTDLTGVTLKQFILRQRIDRANFMLTDTNRSVKDIAKELGFTDAHNFSRTYKKVTGLSPSDYRNTFDKRLLFHI